MLEGAADGVEEGDIGVLRDQPHLEERPERMDRAGIEAYGIDRAVFHEAHKRRDDVEVGPQSPRRPIDERPLGTHPPEEVVVGEHRHELARRGGSEVARRGRGGGGRSAFVDDPEDPAVALVAQGGFVGVPLAVLEAGRRGIVLDDVVVPIDHPHLAVRAHLGGDRRRPFVVAGEEIPGHPAREAGAAGRELEGGDDVAGRLTDEGGAIPVFARIGAGGVEPVAGGGGELAEMIDLPDRSIAAVEPLGDLHRRTAGDPAEGRGAPAADALVNPIGQRHVFAGIAVGGRAEDEALFGETKAPGVVVRAAEELELRAVGKEAEEAGPEAHRLTTDLAIEAGIADHPVHPAVETPGEIAGARVGVAGAPAGEEDLALLTHPVAVGVGKKEHRGGLGDDPAVAVMEEARGNGEPLGDDGARVVNAIGVGIVQADDPVVPLAVSGEDDLVGVVDALGDEQPALGVKGHRQRLGFDHRLGGGKRDLKTLWHEGMFPRLFGREGRLHLGDRLELHPPLLATGVVGGDLRRDKLKRRQARGEDVHRRVIDIRAGCGRVAACRPADAALDEILKAGMAPGALVVPPGGVEDAPLPFAADPGPRLVEIPLDALLENRPAARVVAGVDVGLVPALKALEIVHDRMLGSENRRPKLAAVVALELGADHVDPDGRIAKTKTRAVERHEAVPRADKVDERGFAIGRELIDVGVDSQCVVLRERLRVQILEPLGVDKLDAAVGKDRLELREAVGGAMVPLVAEEQDAERFFSGGHRLGPREPPAGDEPHEPYPDHANGNLPQTPHTLSLLGAPSTDRADRPSYPTCRGLPPPKSAGNPLETLPLGEG